VTEVTWELELIILVIRSHRESDFIVETDVGFDNTSADSTVSDLVHVGHHFFTEAFRWLLFHDLFQLVEVFNGVFLKWHGVDVDLTARCDMCAALKGYDKLCPKLSGWHYTIKKDEYKQENYCLALVDTKGTTCAAYCKKQKLQCYFA
jgi:hypothetical protein